MYEHIYTHSLSTESRDIQKRRDWNRAWNSRSSLTKKKNQKNKKQKKKKKKQKKPVLQEYAMNICSEAWTHFVVVLKQQTKIFLAKTWQTWQWGLFASHSMFDTVKFFQIAPKIRQLIFVHARASKL